MAKSAYLNTLPKKIVGSAAIFLNTAGELLIVKPTYRDGWLVPGGGTELNESPKEGCLREIKEEIGLDVTDVRFVNVQYNRSVTEEGDTYDSLQFTFYGGVLTDEQISQIRLQAEELSEMKWINVNDVDAYLVPKLAYRIRESLAALTNNVPVYTEQVALVKAK